MRTITETRLREIIRERTQRHGVRLTARELGVTASALCQIAAGGTVYPKVARALGYAPEERRWRRVAMDEHGAQ